MKNKMKNKSLLVGVLGGVAVGAVLGILFAPEKGEDTRQKISKKGKDLQDNWKDTASKYASKFSESVDGLRNHVGDRKQT